MANPSAARTAARHGPPAVTSIGVPSVMLRRDSPVLILDRAARNVLVLRNNCHWNSKGCRSFCEQLRSAMRPKPPNLISAEMR